MRSIKAALAAAFLLSCLGAVQQAAALCIERGGFPFETGVLACLSGTALDAALSFSRGPVPPSNADGGGAPQGYWWDDTSVTPETLRYCQVSQCHPSYVAGDWGLVGTFAGGLFRDAIQFGGVHPHTAPYQIVPADVGFTVLMSGGPGILTLPPTSGFAPNDKITVCNTNANDASHHAFTLIGFPDPSLPHLWMQQCETVQNENGSWQATSLPGKFRSALSPQCYVDNAGNNANDGLVSNAANSAVYDPQQCITTWMREFDMRLTTPDAVFLPSIWLTAGQTFNQDGGAGYLYLETWPVVPYVNVNGVGTATVRNTLGQVVVQEGDFGGYFIFGNTGGNLVLDCTGAAAHPCYPLFIHQQNGFDVFNSLVTFKGADPTDVLVYCDSWCKANFGGTPTFAGTFNSAVYGQLDSQFLFSHGANIAAGATSIASLFSATQNSSLLVSGTVAFGSGVTLGGNTIYVTGNSIGLFAPDFAVTGSPGGTAVQYSALNGGQLCNASSTVIPGPGGAGRTTAAGFNPGAAIASGGSCFP